MTAVIPLVNMSALSATMIQTSQTDNARGGYCAKGVANILERVGLDCTRGNAHTWDDTLPQNGWQKLEGITPENAPPGAVIVYDRDANYAGKGGGAEYGHVEIVAEDANGNRKYVSDAARDNWGGTVPDNFVGVYIHPDLHRTVAGTGTVLAADQPVQYEIYNDEYAQRVRNSTSMDHLLLGGALDANTPENVTSMFNDASVGTPFMALMVIIGQIFGIEMNLDKLTQNTENAANNDANTNTAPEETVDITDPALNASNNTGANAPVM